MPLIAGGAQNANVAVLINGRQNPAVGFYADCPNAAGGNNTNSPGNGAYLDTFGSRYYTMYAVLNIGNPVGTQASATFAIQVSPVSGTPAAAGTGIASQWINLPTGILIGNPFTLNSATVSAMGGFTQPLVKLRVNLTAYTPAGNNDDKLWVWVQHEA